MLRYDERLIESSRPHQFGSSLLRYFRKLGTGSISRGPERRADGAQNLLERFDFGGVCILSDRHNSAMWLVPFQMRIDYLESAEHPDSVVVARGLRIGFLLNTGP